MARLTKIRQQPTENLAERSEQSGPLAPLEQSASAPSSPGAVFDPVPSLRRGEQAIAAFQEAASLEAMPRIAPGDRFVYGLDAERARAREEALLQPTSPIGVNGGEAIAWDNKHGEAFLGETAFIVDTLELLQHAGIGLR
jgi:hypothetical protein